LKDYGKHKFTLKRKEGKAIYFVRESSKEKLTGQNEKEKTAKGPTKDKSSVSSGKDKYKINPPKRKRSNQKQAKAKKITLFAGGKKGLNKIEQDKTLGDDRDIGKEKPDKTSMESKKFRSFGKKKKDFKVEPSDIKVSDKRSIKIRRHAFFEKKKSLGKNSDDHKTIEPLTSGLDVEKPFISPILETKLEKMTDDKKLKLEDVEKLKLDTLKKLGFSTKESWDDLDFYPLKESFTYAQIIRDTKTLDMLYILVEIGLSDEESKNLEFIKETLNVSISDTDELESKGKEKYLREKVEQIIEDYSLKMDVISKRKITYFLEKQLLGFDKLEPLMNDSNIEDISCDGSNVPIFLYHRKYGSLKSNIEFENEDELSSFVVKLAQKCGKHISIANPMLDGTMPDGSRIQMTLSTEVTTKGSTFTIRKFKENPFSPADLIEFNTMSPEMVAFLWMAVENGISALMAGGTASGKTSTLNALSLFIPSESKIVSIEETREINLPHKNWIPGVARVGFGDVVGDKIVGEIDMYELMKAALRQRPEYILVGEIRGREAYVLFQAMATGHTTYSTVHADSAKSLIHRLEGKPIEIPRIMLQALDVVCIQTISRVKDKRARKCKQIIEIVDIDPNTKEILTNEVFRWDPVEDKFVYSGKSYILERIRANKGLSREEMTNEIKNRAALMEWMRKKDIKDFREVASMAMNYVENPLEFMKKVKEDS